MHLARFAGFTVISCLSGIAYLKYRQYANINQEIQTMISTNKLKQFLFNFHEDNAYYIDDMMISFEASYNMSIINQYKQTLLQFALGKVLQTCAGTNRNLPFYKPGTDLTLIDWSPNMATVGTTKTSPTINFNYVIGDVTEMPFKDNQFDSVVDFFGLEYVMRPQEALKEMMRVCKKDGRIILMNEGLSSIVEFHYFQNAKFGVNLYNRGMFSNRNWQKIIKDTKLQVESCERKKNGRIYIYVLKNNKGTT